MTVRSYGIQIESWSPEPDQREEACSLGREGMLGFPGSVRDCVRLLGNCPGAGWMIADPAPSLAHRLFPVCYTSPNIWVTVSYAVPEHRTLSGDNILLVLTKGFVWVPAGYRAL